MNIYLYPPDLQYMLKLLTTVVLLLCPALADAISADQIMANARYASTLNDIEFKGQLKHGRDRTDVTLKMLRNDIQLYYEKNNATHGMRLVLQQDSCSLFAISPTGQLTQFPESQVGASIEGTDFTYEDLSLRFLYWDQAHLLREESVKTQKCYVLRAENPGKSGNYKYVDLWIHKDAFALMKMQAYDAQGNHIKTMEASDLMNVNDKIMMKKMKVMTIAGGKTSSYSYLILQNPEGIKKSARPRKLR